MPPNFFDQFDAPTNPLPVAAPKPTGNFFDQFDAPAPVAPRPTFSERFMAHAKVSGANQTYSGAAGKPDALTEGVDLTNLFDVGGRTAEARAAQEALPAQIKQNTIADERTLVAMPDSETLTDYLAAIGGELAPAIADPINAVGFGLPAKAVTALPRLSPVVARTLGRGAETAAANVVVDPLVQAGRVAEGVQENYDPLRTVISGALGFPIGAGFQLGGETVKGLRSLMAKKRAAPEADVDVNALTKDDILDPEVIAFLEKEGVVSSEDPRFNETLARAQQPPVEAAPVQPAAPAQVERAPIEVVQPVAPPKLQGGPDVPKPDGNQPLAPRDGASARDGGGNRIEPPVQPADNQRVAAQGLPPDQAGAGGTRLVEPAGPDGSPAPRPRGGVPEPVEPGVSAGRVEERAVEDLFDPMPTPRKQLPENNFAERLSDHTKHVYSEQSIEKAEEFLPGMGVHSEFGEMYVADTPNMALGQGKNKGVMFVFDASKLEGQRARHKPGLDQAWLNGEGEYYLRGHRNTQKQIQDAVVAFRIMKSAGSANLGVRGRLKNWMDKKWHGPEWERRDTPDYIEYTRKPATPAEKPAAVEAPKTVEPVVAKPDELTLPPAVKSSEPATTDSFRAAQENRKRLLDNPEQLKKWAIDAQFTEDEARRVLQRNYESNARRLDKADPPEKIKEASVKLYSNPLDPDAIKSVVKGAFGKAYEKYAERRSAEWADSMDSLKGIKKAWGGDPRTKKLIGLGRQIWDNRINSLRVLADRFPDKTGAPSKTITQVADHFGAPAGETKRAVPQTFFEEVDEWALGHGSNRLQKSLQKHFPDVSLELAATEAGNMKQLGNLLANGKITRGQSKLHNAAADIRDQLEEWYNYAIKAGVPLGKVHNYFPDSPDRAKITAEPEKYKVVLTRAYQMPSTDGPGLPLPQAKEAAEAYLERINNEGLGIGEIGLFDFQKQSGKVKNEKGRVFGPAARRLLQEEGFYKRDPREVLPEYFRNMATRVALARRFGPAGEKWDEMKLEMEKEGLSQPAIAQVADYIQSMTGRIPTGVPDNIRAVVSGLRMWASIKLLPKAVLSSLTEPLLQGARSGHLGDAMTGYGATMAALKGRIAKNGKEFTAKAREIADDLGVIASAFHDGALGNRFEGLADSNVVEKQMAKFYRWNGLHQWTEGTRVAAVYTSQRFVRRIGAEIAERSDSAAFARGLLAELGVPADKQDSFLKWLDEQPNRMPDPDTLRNYDDPNVQMYRTAVARFVGQSALKPTAADRAKYADHPILGLPYYIQSFLFAMNERVLKRFGRLMKRAATGDDMTAYDRFRLVVPMLMMAPIILSQAAIRAWVLDAYNKDPGKDPKYQKKSIPEQVTRALSGAGTFGQFDTAVNLFTSARFEGSLPGVILGPALGGEFRAAEKGLGALPWSPQNSDTNAAERGAANAFYSWVLDPALNVALMNVPGGPLIKGASLATGLRMGQPEVREKFVEGVAGPPTWKDRRYRPKRPERPGRPTR